MSVCNLSKFGLLYLQQCTGVDDLETCMAILEHHDWNLQVRKYLIFDVLVCSHVSACLLKVY